MLARSFAKTPADAKRGCCNNGTFDAFGEGQGLSASGSRMIIQPFPEAENAASKRQMNKNTLRVMDA